MVFPSLRCLTCKERRVKCDYTRPSCSRCSKASRTCTWESGEADKLPFKSENAFARGTQRRPRKGPVTAGLISPGSKASDTLPSPIAQALSLPIEVHALWYWAENFATWPQDGLDIGNEYGTLALWHYARSEPDSSLHLAVQGFSLATFGLGRHVGKAFEDARKFYARCIVKMQGELMCLREGTIDQLLLATLLLTTYDNIMHGAKTSRTLDHPSHPRVPTVRHFQGTASLIQERHQKAFAKNYILDSVSRRLIIRGCILRGISVPDWLDDKQHYCVEDPQVRLDSLMIQVAALRRKGLSCHDGDLILLLSEARDVDNALSKWAEAVPADWRFAVNQDSSELAKCGLSHESHSHQYSTQSHAAVWNRYRAVRLIVNSLISRLLSVLRRRNPTDSFLALQLELCQTNLGSLTDDMCRSVFFFFKIDTEVTPKIATLLAWPLQVAVNTEAVPEPQKKWLKGKLNTIANVLGASVLHSDSESENFNVRLGSC